MNNQKEHLRQKIKKKREKLEKKKAKSLSNKIIEKLKKTLEIKKAKKIAIYLDYNNEVMTEKLKKWLLKNQKQVFVPKITKKRMVFIRINEKTKFKKNKAGIKEPQKGKETNPKKIELFIVPGIAFTKNKQRIGSGKGHYDKFFSKYKIKAKKIGLAYDFQIIEKIKKENHDTKMNAIITEKRVIK